MYIKNLKYTVFGNLGEKLCKILCMRLFSLQRLLVHFKFMTNINLSLLFGVKFNDKCFAVKDLKDFLTVVFLDLISLICYLYLLLSSQLINFFLFLVFKLYYGPNMQIFHILGIDTLDCRQ